MSLATWKEEFYPVEANDCPKDEAVAHSLRKWQGLREAALAKHKLSVAGQRLEGADGFVFWIDATSCALCSRYFVGDAARPCRTCPLAIARGGIGCDRGESAPWHAWIDYQDPEPMIAALEAAAKAQGGAA